MSEYHNQWFARMALVALGKKHCVCTGTFGTEIKPVPGSSPSRGRALRLWGLGMACWGLNHEVG
jgi:hypothetical protein